MAIASEWTRSTRAGAFDSLGAAIRAAIARRAEELELGDPGAIASGCWETTSTRSVRRLLGLYRREDRTVVGAVLTPRWLLIGTDDGEGGIGVLAARLAQLEATDHDRQIVDDRGLTLFGTFFGHAQSLRYTFWLGPEDAATEAVAAIKGAVRAAHGE